MKAPSLGHLIGTLLGAPENRDISVFHDKIYYYFNIILYFFKNFEKKRTLYLKKNFNFIIVFSRTTRKQAVPPSPVKLLPRNRHRSREVVGPASPAGCRSPPRKQSFGIRQRNFRTHGLFSASRVLIAFSGPKERVYGNKTVSSWSRA